MYDYILIYLLLSHQNVCVQLNIYAVLKVVKLFIAK